MLQDNDVDKILSKYNEDVKRHISVLQEDMDDKFKLLAEQVGANTEGITEIQEKLEQHDQKFEKIGVQLFSVENRLGSVEGRLNKVENKQKEHDGRFDRIDQKLKERDKKLDEIAMEKVSKGEFIILKNRVDALGAA